MSERVPDDANGVALNDDAVDGAMPELFSPGRKIQATIVDLSGPKVRVEKYSYPSRLTKGFADRINAECERDGEPKLFRHWDEIEVPSETSLHARGIGKAIISILGLFR